MRKAGDIITALFKERFGPDFTETARTSAGLFSSWALVVAEAWPCADRSMAEDIPAAAAHSAIRELERGVLLVEADHPGWVQILQTKQAELLSAVQRRYPELGIRGIAFRLSREPFFSPEFSRKNEFFGQPSEVPVSPEALTPAEDRSYACKSGQDASRDEEFYAALKGLEESIKKRNSL